MSSGVGLARRAGWGIADQALSSLTNLALGLAVARSVGTAEFGAFSLAFATYLLVLILTRAVGAQPLVIRYSAHDEQRWRSGVATSSGAVLAVGLAGAAVAAVTAALTAGALASAFAALALTLPGLLVQDSWRFAFFAKGDGRRAFLNDAVYAALLLPALATIVAAGRSSVFTATLLWGAAAGAAALFGIWQARVRPRLLGTPQWLREHRDVIPTYIAEFGSTPAANHAALFGVGGVASLAAVGALRAAEIVLGPIRSLFEGVSQVAQPEAVRMAASARRLMAPCAVLSAALAAISVVVGTAVSALPDSIGQRLLGDTWSAADEVLVPLVVAFTAAGLIVGAQMGLHALVAVRRSLHSRLSMSAAVVILVVAGAVVDGAPGAAWGRALAMCAGAVLWWWHFRRALRERRRRWQPQ